VSPRTIEMTDDLNTYLADVGVRDTPLLRQLREETQGLRGGHMQIAPEQGQMMAFLVELMGARHILEIGTFTGYSTLCMALAMPEAGHIDACDTNAETTQVARRYWQSAGVSDRIQLHIGNARETMAGFLQNGHAGDYDLIFVDADKVDYDAYYEMGLRLLRPGGMMMFDNMLWHGKVVDPAASDDDTDAIRALNSKLHGDSRVAITLIPIGDGITLARKR
jgi:predicted O-methyltransferase YrrM